MKLRNCVDGVAIFVIWPWLKESKLSIKHWGGKKKIHAIQGSRWERVQEMDGTKTVLEGTRQQN